MNATQEQWRPIPGYEGSHVVSNRGRARSLDRPDRDLHPNIVRKDGSHSVLLRVDGHERRKYLHVLVLETFVGPCPNGMKAHRYDEDPDNNTLENLYWDKIHKIRLCLIPECGRKYLARGMCASHYNCLHYKGVPLARYMAIWNGQNGACAICREPQPKLYLDHDHACCPGGQGCGRCIRGLLCPSCNTKMAALDDPVFMEAAPHYLSVKRIDELNVYEAAG